MSSEKGISIDENELKAAFEAKGGKAKDISNLSGVSNETSKQRIKNREL